MPGRIPDMVTSMLQDYKEGGWLPMWKNIVGESRSFLSFFTVSQPGPDVETNIMVGTHADVLVAEAVVKGFGSKI